MPAVLGWLMCLLVLAMTHGTSEDDAARVAQSDLGVPYYEAVRIVSSAELALNCSSLKTHGM